MSEDFLDEFDKISGFEHSAGLNGPHSAAFDFDPEDEMKFNKFNDGNTNKKPSNQPESMNVLKFDNPLDMADDLNDLRSIDQSKGTNLHSNILDFNPNSNEDRNSRPSIPSMTNFLQVPTKPSHKNNTLNVPSSKTQQSKPVAPVNQAVIAKSSQVKVKPTSITAKEKAPASAQKPGTGSSQASKLGQSQPKKPSPTIATTKQAPASPNTKPGVSTTAAKNTAVKGRPTSAMPVAKKEDDQSAKKLSPRKDKANLLGIVLSKPDILKLEIDPLIISEGENFKASVAKQPQPLTGTDGKAVDAQNGTQDDFAEFGDFEAELAAEEGQQSLPAAMTKNEKADTPALRTTVRAALEEPTDQQVGDDAEVEAGLIDEGVLNKKNKFLNVHEPEEDFDDDFAFASNAISDQVGSEMPKVNLENSGVSNRNFDEKMISTVNSEQVESQADQKQKNADEAALKKDKKSMEGIKEESGDNSNSQNKTSSNKQKGTQGTGGLEEPLNQPTFLESNNQIKPNFKQQARDPSSKKFVASNVKTSVPASFQKKDAERGNSTALASKQKKPPVDEPPPKKSKLPDFGLKAVKPPKPIKAEVLLAQAGVEDPNTQTGDFGALLTALTKKVKRELKEIESAQDTKTFKEKKETDLQKDLLERERIGFMKEFINKVKLDEDEKRKKEIEEAKQKLEEFRKKNGVQYPPVKTKPKPPLVEKAKPAEPAKDLIAEANNYIRAGAWRKMKPSEEKKAASEKGQDAKKQEGEGLFEVAEEAVGDNNMPGMRPAVHRPQEPDDDFDGADLAENIDQKPEDDDFKPFHGDVGLANLAENQSEAFFDGIPKGMHPEKSPQPAKNKTGALKKSHLVGKNEKKTVFMNYKQKEAERQRKAEEALMQEAWDKKVKKAKVAVKQTEEEFRIAQDLEEKEKRERLDRYSQGHNTLRYGKQSPHEAGSQAEDKKAKHSEFKLRVGTGVPGVLTQKIETYQHRDIKFRAIEIAKAHEDAQRAKLQEQELFKERLKREKQYLKERALREQEHLRALQAEKVRKNKGDEKKADEEQPKPVVNAFYEQSVEGEQGAAFGVSEAPEADGQIEAKSGPNLKLKHSLKLKAFIQKLVEINNGMIDQIKQRDQEYEQLRKEYETMAINQRKEEDKEKRAIIDSALKKMPVIKLFDLLRGDSSLVRTAQISRHFRDTDELSMVEKKVLKELFSGCGHELLTFTQFEAILKEDELQENLKVAKGAAEIEEDNKLVKFMYQLEDFNDRVTDFNSSVESREIDSFDAYNKIIVLKKEQMNYLASIPQMMDSLTKRLNGLIDTMSQSEEHDNFLVGFEEVDKTNKEKLGKLQSVYHDALNEFDETDTRLKNLQLFDIKDFEELQIKERSLASAAFEATSAIHKIGFKQKNDILNFIAFAGKEKKSALLIQAWFRGYKARKTYGAKKCFRQRLWYLVNRWIKRFRKRAATKMIPELLDSFYRAKLHLALRKINNERIPKPFDRKLSELTLKMLSSRLAREDLNRIEFDLSGQGSQLVGDQALPGHNGLKESYLSLGKQKSLVKEYDEQSAENASEIYEERLPNKIAWVDGQAIYYALILQRYYRFYRKKDNPEVFFVSPYEAVDKCRLCQLAPVRVVVPETHICLYCTSCFTEMNAQNKKTRKFKLLKANPRAPRGLSDNQMIERAKEVFTKITKVRDFEVLCRAWDYDSSGLIQMDDLEMLVDRLKMITQTEKTLFLKVCASQQDAGHVDYGGIIGSLGR